MFLRLRGAATSRPFYLRIALRAITPAAAAAFSLLTYEKCTPLGSTNRDGNSVALHAALAARAGLRSFLRMFVASRTRIERC